MPKIKINKNPIYPKFENLDAYIGGTFSNIFDTGIQSNAPKSIQKDSSDITCDSVKPFCEVKNRVETVNKNIMSHVKA